MNIDERTIKQALKARSGEILSNLDTMSLKSCRQTLEQDLGLQSGALKPYKEVLSGLIDKLIAKHNKAMAASGATEQKVTGTSGKKKPASQEQPKKKAAAAELSGSEVEEGEEEEEQPSKRQKREAKPTKQSGPRQYGPKVKKLQGICKAATITIPPTLYVRNKTDGELQAALEALLEKHDLDASAGEREISRARARLQTQRDLDGIDTSNIIEGGRRRRGGAQPVSYKKLVDPASDEEEEEEEESEEEESDAASGSEEEAAGSDGEADSADERPAKAAKPAARKKQAKAASSSDDEEEQEENAEFASPAAAAKSPDENAAARGNSGNKSTGKAAGGTKAATKAQPANSLEDSEGEEPVAVEGKRRALAEWSDDE